MKKTILAISLFTVVTPAMAGGMLVYDGLVHATLTTNFLALNTSINAIIAQLGTANTSLYNIGTAVTQSGGKVASTIEASAKAQRDFDVEMKRTTDIQQARKAYQVAGSICTESASGGASQVGDASGAAKSGFRPGGGAPIANKAISDAVNGPAKTLISDASITAKISASYCDASDYSAYGGTPLCQSVNNAMPAADKRIDTLMSGAGKDGKAPELTFTQAQTDVARMYTKNSIRRSVGKKLSKSEAQSSAGAQYIGSTTQLESILSAAADPQDRALADRQPMAITKELLEEATQAPSAKTYFSATASSEAKRTGLMSKAEFESFEVGRRYANTDYQSDLQQMSGDNLVREQIRVATLQNWLLWEMKNEVVNNGILLGQQLASAARTEFEPILASKYQSIASKLGGS